MDKTKMFHAGGFVPNGYKPPLLERGWWKCLKCGRLFEADSNPPLGNEHVCHAEQKDTSNASN